MEVETNIEQWSCEHSLKTTVYTDQSSYVW